jgi:hypothetical protein
MRIAAFIETFNVCEERKTFINKPFSGTRSHPIASRVNSGLVDDRAGF